MKRYRILKNYLDDEMDLREGAIYRFFKNYHTVFSLMKIRVLVEKGILHPLDNPPFPKGKFQNRRKQKQTS